MLSSPEHDVKGPFLGRLPLNDSALWDFASPKANRPDVLTGTHLMSLSVAKQG
jgi:hypothetical protein